MLFKLLVYFNKRLCKVTVSKPNKDLAVCGVASVIIFTRL